MLEKHIGFFNKIWKTFTHVILRLTGSGAGGGSTFCFFLREPSVGVSEIIHIENTQMS